MDQLDGSVRVAGSWFQRKAAANAGFKFTLHLCTNLPRSFLSGRGKIMVGVPPPCVDEQRNFSFWNCHGAFTSQFIYSAGEAPPPEPVASLPGTARKPSDCSGKVARVHFEERNGNTQKGTDAREEDNKNVAYVLWGRAGDKTSEDTQRWRHTGGKAVIPPLCFPKIRVPCLQTS